MSRTGWGSRTTGFGSQNYGPVGGPIFRNNFYAINNVANYGLDEERNALACFDTSTKQPCLEHPIPVKYPATWIQQSTNTAWTRLINNKIYIFQPGKLGNGTDWDALTCVDPAAADFDCGGKWPVRVPSSASSQGNDFSDLFPYRTDPNIDSGVCIGGATLTNKAAPRSACWDLSGNFIGCGFDWTWAHHFAN